MDKFLIISVGNAFDDINYLDTIWDYVTSEENAKIVSKEYSKDRGQFYYINKPDYDGRINLDHVANRVKNEEEYK